MSDEKREHAGHETGAETEETKTEETAEEPPQDAEPAEAGPEETVERTPEDQLGEMKDRLLRAMAETENIRRRSEREKAEAQKFGISRFARDLLSVADNLRRAVDAVPDEKREDLDEVTQNLITGVEMVERELLSTFERHGITPLQPEKGTRFDPNLHQAMAEVPDPDAPPGTIAGVFQTGYIIEDRLLRPAMVTVARAPANDESNEPEAAEKGGSESAAKAGNRN